MAKRKPIEQMTDEERRAYQDRLIDELRGHVSKSGDGMTRREQLERMSYEERAALIRELQAEILARLEALFGKAPAPVEPEPPEPPIKPKAKPKAKRSKRIERFDDLDDAAQIDHLKGLWGES